MSDVTDEMLDEAFAMDAAITEDRSPEAQQARAEAVAAAVEAENAGAPSEEEVEALYTGEALPEPEPVDTLVEYRDPEPEPDVGSEDG
jgi:hypothetical protein